MTDIALRLAERDLYGIVWSEAILEEAHRNLLADGRGDRAYCERRKTMIRKYFAEGEARDFEPLIPLLACEPKDRHVLAAAIRGGAEQIVTFDLHAFPNAALEPHGIEAIHPDEFFQNVLDLGSRLVLEVPHRAIIKSQATAVVVIRHHQGDLNGWLPNVCSRT